jgi:hypothetical protein
MYSRSAKGGEKADPNRNPWLAKMKCLWCWPVKCSIQRNSEHNEWIDLNTMSVIRWAGTAYSFGTPELSSCFLFGTCCSSLVFCVFFSHWLLLVWSLFVTFLSFFLIFFFNCFTIFWQPIGILCLSWYSSLQSQNCNSTTIPLTRDFYGMISEKNSKWLRTVDL